MRCHQCQHACPGARLADPEFRQHVVPWTPRQRPRVRAPADAPPIVILPGKCCVMHIVCCAGLSQALHNQLRIDLFPGFGNCASDYTEALGNKQASITTALEVRLRFSFVSGAHSVVTQVAKLTVLCVDCRHGASRCTCCRLSGRTGSRLPRPSLQQGFGQPHSLPTLVTLGTWTWWTPLSSKLLQRLERSRHVGQQHLIVAGDQMKLFWNYPSIDVVLPAGGAAAVVAVAQVDLVCHSAGGWLGRAYIGDPAYFPDADGRPASSSSSWWSWLLGVLPTLAPLIVKAARSSSETASSSSIASLSSIGGNMSTDSEGMVSEVLVGTPVAMAHRPNPWVRSIVTLGSPQKAVAPEKGRDMTGGALSWVHRRFPGMRSEQVCVCIAAAQSLCAAQGSGLDMINGANLCCVRACTACCRCFLCQTGRILHKRWGPHRARLS